MADQDKPTTFAGHPAKPGAAAPCGPYFNPSPPLASTLQARVWHWCFACFGPRVAVNSTCRNHAFLEEALEVVQARGMSQVEAFEKVAYVYGRAAGEDAQEIGGAMITLAALATAAGIDWYEAGETELARVWQNMDKIRAKQAAKKLPDSAASE